MTTPDLFIAAAVSIMFVAGLFLLVVNRRERLVERNPWS